MRVEFVCAWYDLWIGAYWDSSKRKLYILPVPCLGVALCFGRAATAGGEHAARDSVKERARADRAEEQLEAAEKKLKLLEGSAELLKDMAEDYDVTPSGWCDKYSGKVDAMVAKLENEGFV